MNPEQPRITSEDAEKMRAYFKQQEEPKAPAGEKEKTPEADDVDKKINEIDKREGTMGKKQEFKGPAKEEVSPERELTEEEKQKVAEHQEAQPESVRPYPEDSAVPAAEEEKTAEVKEEREKAPEEKAEGKNEKTKKDLLVQRLEAERGVCAEASHQKDKAAKFVQKTIGWRRFFMSEKKVNERTASDEDYKVMEENYKKSQEDYKAVLKEYRLFSLEEKRQQLEKNHAEFIKKLPHGEKLSEDILKNAKLEDLLLIEMTKGTGQEGKRLEEQKYKDAAARQKTFIKHLKEQGVEDEEAKGIYKQLALGELTIGKEATDQQLEKFAKQLTIETSAKEATKLYLAKYEKEIEERKKLEGETKLDWIKTKGLEVAQWYRKLPAKYKWAITGALVGSSIVTGGSSLFGLSALVGGTTASVVGGAAVGAGWMQRVLGGAGVAVGIEAKRKHKQEKKAEEKVNKEFGGNFLQALQEKNDAVDDKLFEILGKKKSEERNRYLYAGVAGVFVGSGAFGYIIREGIHNIPDSIREPLLQKIHGVAGFVSETYDSVKGKLPGGAKPVGPGMGALHPMAGAEEELIKSHGAAGGSVIGPEGPLAPEVPEVSDVVMAQKGDNVWKLLEKQLEARGHFADLSGSAEEIRAAKTYMIDALKDKVVANPQAFGLDNPDLIKPGQTINFGGLFEDNEKLDQIFDHAQNLSDSEVKNILSYKPLPSAAGIPTGTSAGQGYLGVTSESLPPSPDDGPVSMEEVLPDKPLAPTGDAEEIYLDQSASQGPEDVPAQEARAIDALNQGDDAKHYVVNYPGEAEEVVKKMAAAKPIPVSPEPAPASLEPVSVSPESKVASLKPSPVSLEELHKIGFSDDEVKKIGDKMLAAGREVPTLSDLAGQPLKAIELKGVPLANKLDLVTNSIKGGSLTPEEFGKYYTGKFSGGAPLSPELAENLRTTFEDIKGADAAKRLSAEKAIKAILQRIESVIR